MLNRREAVVGAAAVAVTVAVPANNSINLRPLYSFDADDINRWTNRTVWNDDPMPRFLSKEFRKWVARRIEYETQHGQPTMVTYF